MKFKDSFKAEPSKITSVSFICPSCKASVPSMINQGIALHCPYCGAPLKDAEKVLNQILETEKLEAQTNARLRILENKRQKSKNDNITDIILLALFILFPLILILALKSI